MGVKTRQAEADKWIKGSMHVTQLRPVWSQTKEKNNQAWCKTKCMATNKKIHEKEASTTVYVLAQVLNTNMKPFFLAKPKRNAVACSILNKNLYWLSHRLVWKHSALRLQFHGPLSRGLLSVVQYPLWLVRHLAYPVRLGPQHYLWLAAESVDLVSSEKLELRFQQQGQGDWPLSWRLRMWVGELACFQERQPLVSRLPVELFAGVTAEWQLTGQRTFELLELLVSSTPGEWVLGWSSRQSPEPLRLWSVQLQPLFQVWVASWVVLWQKTGSQLCRAHFVF